MRRRDPALLRQLHFEHDECVLCGGGHNLHLHHVLYRSQGGDDVRANIVPLCRECHDHVHRGNDGKSLLVAYITEWRQDTVAYLVEKLGEGWWWNVRSGG